MVPNPPTLLLVSVGNTRTRAASLIDGKLHPSKLLTNMDEAGSTRGLIEAVMALPPATDSTILLASVNESVAGALAEALGSGPTGRRVIRVVSPAGDGVARGLEAPIRCDLEPPITVGVDRLLNALAAHERSGEACVVVDCGTAVTVDFVDQWGVFRGGCIGPGLGLSLRALHAHTAALPLIRSEEVKAIPEAPGRTTREAMLAGCAAAIRGMIHGLVERYAEVNGRYPRVIATGGDAPLLLETDGIVEHIVPDLTLMGLVAVWERTRAGAPEAARPA